MTSPRSGAAYPFAEKNAVRLRWWTSPPPPAASATPSATDSIASLAGLRVLLVHDWLVTWGGAERCIAELVDMFPDADLVVGVRSRSIAELNATTQRARETWLGLVPGARDHHRWFLPLQAAAFATLDTRGYDLIISSSHAFAKMVRPRENALHVCYCHSPPRYLWELEGAYRKAARGFQRVAFVGAAGMLRRIDRASADHVHHFIANSNYIAERVRRCYGRHADVVYPPVVAKPAQHVAGPRGDFLLSIGRLVPYKRVDLAVQAAERLGVRLIVAGDGPERAKLESIAGPHTEFVGPISEQEAGRLLSTCAAFVFCAEEDFGIAPVEANAHGAPVVGYARGGLLETMQPGVTAELFEEQTVDAIVHAIRRALDRQWSANQLLANAQRFSRANFRAGILQSIHSALAATGHVHPSAAP